MKKGKGTVTQTDDFVETIRLMKVRQREAEQHNQNCWDDFLPSPPFVPREDISAIRFVINLINTYRDQFETASQRLLEQYNFAVQDGLGFLHIITERPEERFYEELDSYQLYQGLWIETALAVRLAQIDGCTVQAIAVRVQDTIRKRLPLLIAEGRYKGTLARYGRTMAIMDATAYVSDRIPVTERIKAALQGEDKDTELFAIVADSLKTYQHVDPNKGTVEGFNSLIKQVKKELIKNAPEQTKWTQTSVEALNIELPSRNSVDPLDRAIMNQELDAARAEVEAQRYGLSPIEYEIWDLSTKGYTYREIAELRDISISRVRDCLMSARRKKNSKKSA